MAACKVVQPGAADKSELRSGDRRQSDAAAPPDGGRPSSAPATPTAGREVTTSDSGDSQYGSDDAGAGYYGDAGDKVYTELGLASGAAARRPPGIRTPCATYDGATTSHGEGGRHAVVTQSASRPQQPPPLQQRSRGAAGGGADSGAAMAYCMRLLHSPQRR